MAPFPSSADAAYLLFYPLILAGLSTFPAAPQSRLERTTFWLDATTLPVGDEVLRLVARRMRETFRDVDLLGRDGGDEFVVMLPKS